MPVALSRAESSARRTRAKPAGKFWIVVAAGCVINVVVMNKSIEFQHLLLLLAILWTPMARAAETDRKLADGLYAEMDTSKGKILLRLEYEKVPLTVANFVGLAEGTKHYSKTAGQPPSAQGKALYDGLTFHRVIPDFMIQGGDPEGTGRGGPGYQFADEIDPSLKHDGPGVLSMANSGPASNGSQFFITHKETPWLDGKHSVFGRVIEGQDVVNKIAVGDKMNSVRILRIGEKAKAFRGDEAQFAELLKKVEAKRGAEQQARSEKDKKLLDDYLAELNKKFPDKLKTAPSGLKYVVTKEGAGDKPAKGKAVKAHYTGKLLNGTVFDSSIQRGKPIEFPVGEGRVIKGWDEALSDMKKGEQRILIIPPDLAYGERGYGGVIPPNATLNFEVELVDF